MTTAYTIVPRLVRFENVPQNSEFVFQEKKYTKKLISGNPHRNALNEKGEEVWFDKSVEVYAF